MKRLKLALVLGVSVLALTACGAKGVENQDATAKEPAVQSEAMEDNMKGSNDKMESDKMEKEMSDDKMMDNSKEDEMDDKMSDSKMDDKKRMKDDKMNGKKMEKKNEGDIAKDFSLKDKDGNEFTLSKRTGNKVYVKFWASWCSVCLAGLEELNTLAGEQNDFEIVTIVAPGVRGEKSQEDFIKWFDTLGYNNIKVLFDEGGEVMADYGVRAFPSSAMVGTDGILAGFAPGHLSSDMIKDFFAKVQ